jgi:toluene monooxygenase electron transfer component
MPTITIADTGQQFECGPDDTLTRAGLRAGLGMPYECNVGCCGTCKLELVAGEVSPLWAEAPALTERDRSKNRVLGCQSRPASDCTIKVRLEEIVAGAQRPRRFRARLTAIRDLTHDMREFQFRGDEKAQFLPGQYLLFSLPGVPGQRAYSMANVPDRNGEWHFHVKRVPGGRCTGTLFDVLHVGDDVDFDGPYGQAYLRSESPRDIVCIAGGSGLSPVMSIARAVANTPSLARRTLHFFYGGRGPQDICGEDMLQALPGFGERLFYYPAISMPELDTQGAWKGRVGFVHEFAQDVLGKEKLKEYEFYFAGPPVMATAVQRMLIQAKVPFNQIHFDRFF